MDLNDYPNRRSGGFRITRSSDSVPLLRAMGGGLPFHWYAMNPLRVHIRLQLWLSLRFQLPLRPRLLALMGPASPLESTSPTHSAWWADRLGPPEMVLIRAFDSESLEVA